MLLEFSVANFRSIKAKQTISFVASEHIRDKMFNVRDLGDVDCKGLPVAVLMGATNSGKSNILHALRFFQKFILSTEDVVAWGDYFDSAFFACRICIDGIIYSLKVIVSHKPNKPILPNGLEITVNGSSRSDLTFSERRFHGFKIQDFFKNLKTRIAVPLHMPAGSVDKLENIELIKEYFPDIGRDANDKKLSYGMMTTIAVAGHAVNILKKGGMLALDDMYHMHPIITRQIIKLFCSKITNPNHAQLLIELDNPSVLDDNNFIRQDQVFFVNKKEGVTTIKPLSDYKCDDGIDYLGLDYMRGSFGSLPEVGDIADIDNILHIPSSFIEEEE
ncbi:MAG: hypothetical protein VKL60_15245 [Sphaerospermopsis sp.]|nr:hypothetical protein [Sphaerospermopsis sp.]